MNLLVAAAAAAVIAVGAGIAYFFWPSSPQSVALVRLKPDEPAVVALGATVYADQCSVCHGATLEGQPDWRVRGADGRLPAPPHDETGHTWHHPDAQLFELTKQGPPKMVAGQRYLSSMPAFGGVLSDEEIIAALSYIKSRWPAEIRERHDAANAQAAAR